MLLLMRSQVLRQSSTAAHSNNLSKHASHQNTGSPQLSPAQPVRLQGRARTEGTHQRRDVRGAAVPAPVALAPGGIRQLLQQAQHLGMGQAKQSRPMQAYRARGCPCMHACPCRCCIASLACPSPKRHSGSRHPHRGVSTANASWAVFPALHSAT